MKYEKYVQDICNVEDVQLAEGDELDGCLGVAIAMSYMHGIEAEINSLSAYLEIPVCDLQEPFERLKINGVFGPKYNIRRDKVLKGHEKSSPSSFVTAKHYTRLAWCIISGIAQGYGGVR